MKLPTDCRYAAKAPTRRSIISKIEDGEIACCRSNQQLCFGQRDECQPLCRVEGDEVYCFNRMQAFGEHAMICIARRGDGFTIDGAYYAGMFNEAEPLEASLCMSDWRRLQDALIAANFWSLPPRVHARGVLDGYTLVVKGRRGNVFRATCLTNPDVQELWQLGRVAFNLAGLDRVQF